MSNKFKAIWEEEMKMNSPQKTARTAVSDTLFRLSLASDLIRQVLLMVLPLILYKLLRPVNKDWAAVIVAFAQR
jgi:hypothetical protein